MGALAQRLIDLIVQQCARKPFAATEDEERRKRQRVGGEKHGENFEQCLCVWVSWFVIFNLFSFGLSVRTGMQMDLLDWPPRLTESEKRRGESGLLPGARTIRLDKTILLDWTDDSYLINSN